MDFREFMLKKKIDLQLFSRAEPELFAEFETEYGLMGPKSFDHTKKFWFNKLRRLYHLAVQENPTTLTGQTEPAAQASTLQSPTIQQKPAYVPRFKAPAPKPEE